RDAVAAHHHGACRAERGGEQVAQLARADEPHARILGHAAGEDAALVVHDAVRLADLREAYAGARMRVHHAAHVGTRRVDARVDPELAVRLALAFAHASAGVDHQQAI